MGAESNVVKELIEANLNQLKQQLSDQGLVIDSFKVMVGLDDRRFKEGESWAGGRRKNSSSSKGSGTGIEATAIEEKSLSRTMDSLYQIDVHV